MRTHLIHGLSALAVIVLAACGGHQQQAQDPSNAGPKPQATMTTPAPQEPLVSDADPQKPGAGPAVTAPEEKSADTDQQKEKEKAKGPPLASDGEVLSFAMTVNDGEIQMAELAKKNAESAEVKNFAGLMATHHTQGMAKIRSIQAKTKIELKDNELSTKLKGEVSDKVSMLRDKKGKDFDRAYMDTQVKTHKEALDALDNRVLPAATNGEVKTGIKEMRRQVADHLAKAEEIQKKVDPAAAQARETSEQAEKKAKTDESKKQDTTQKKY
jgi:putative membrane protein